MEDFRTYYDKLNKPESTPAPDTISFIWRVLYPMILVVNVYVILKIIRNEASAWLLLPFGLNLLFNFLFAPIQMGLRNQGLALVCAIAILVTIIWSMVAVWPVSKFAAFAFIPYLAWVTTATILQSSIWFENR